ncbi:MAG: signal peptidase I [Bacilli bacterium]|nr:signal peptidase I [Bacilli bacterium]
MKEIIPYVVVIVIFLLIRAFVFIPILVHGDSMSPTLEDKNFLILNKMDHKYDRFEIVVFDHAKQMLIKRVIGLPGETIEVKAGKLYINGEEMDDPLAEITYDFKLNDLGYTTIPEDTYFVMGDNRNNSIDSRKLGPISKDKIEGTLGFRLIPFKKVEDKYNKKN